MLCKNVSGGQYSFTIDRLPGQPPFQYRLEAGEEVEIDDGYCVPYKTENGRIIEPIVSQITKVNNGTPAMVPTGRYSPGLVRGPLPKSAVQQGQLAGAQPELLGILVQMQAQMAAMQATQDALAAQNASLARQLTASQAPTVTVPGSADDVLDLEDFADGPDEPAGAPVEPAPEVKPATIQGAATAAAELAKQTREAAKGKNTKPEAAK
jgi:hypothetical protein